MKFKIYVQPNANRSEVTGWHGDSIKIKIKAAPVDGEANQEVIRFLSKLLGVSKKEIQILNGESSRHKLIQVNEAHKDLNSILKTCLESTRKTK